MYTPHCKSYRPAYDALQRLCPNIALQATTYLQLYTLAGLITVGSAATDAEFSAILQYRKDYENGEYVWEVEA